MKKQRRSNTKRIDRKKILVVSNGVSKYREPINHSLRLVPNGVLSEFGTPIPLSAWTTMTCIVYEYKYSGKVDCIHIWYTFMGTNERKGIHSLVFFRQRRNSRAIQRRQGQHFNCCHFYTSISEYSGYNGAPSRAEKNVSLVSFRGASG